MTPSPPLETDLMTRGGRRKDRDAPERRCIASGESGPADRMIRFALAPDGAVVPDLAARLPGRGAWLSSSRAAVALALKKRGFARAFKAQVHVPEDLADLLERLLAKRLIDTVAMARKAGAAVTGAEKVRAQLTSGAAAILLQACDGAADGRRKLAALADAAGGGRVTRIELLDSTELGLAFGRGFAIHAALDAGGFADRARRDARRLSGFRSGMRAGDAPDQRQEQVHGGQRLVRMQDNEDVGSDGGPSDKDNT